jgi:hypothetical protein
MIEAISIWYFFILISLIIIVAWIKIIYTKFLNDFFTSALNYQIARKIYNETGIVRKRVGITLDILYLVSGSLFLFAVSEFFNITPFNFSGIRILYLSFIVLLSFIVFRLLIMRLVSVIFHQKRIISEFLHHFYLYNKILGLLLIPFLFLIPYTEGVLQQVSVYVGFILILAVYLYRVFRIIVFLFKNAVFIFYLILYLCVLEILPFLVIIKFLLSLEQGS